MNYEDPRAYWNWRAVEYGPAYVGPGSKPDQSEVEAERFGEAIAEVVGDLRFGSLLDFGCGVGRMTPALGALADRYMGVDISEEAVVRWPHPAPALYVTNDRLPFGDETLDAVACIVVLQHIVAPQDFWRWTSEIHRVLKAGGHVLVIDNRSLRDPAPHMHPRSAVEVAEALGCGVVRRSPLPNHWCALMEKR